MYGPEHYAAVAQRAAAERSARLRRLVSKAEANEERLTHEQALDVALEELRVAWLSMSAGAGEVDRRDAVMSSLTRARWS